MCVVWCGERVCCGGEDGVVRVGKVVLKGHVLGELVGADDGVRMLVA